MKHSKSDGKETKKITKGKWIKKRRFVSTDNGNRVVGLVDTENTALGM